jgi:hypothetical protein
MTENVMPEHAILAIWERKRKQKPVAVNVTHETVLLARPDRPDWRAKALADLREWMLASSQPSVTIETWAAVYIRCGRCLTEWREWRVENPIGDDLPGWLELAKAIVIEKRWV